MEKPQSGVRWQDFVLVALIARVLFRICFTDEKRHWVSNFILFEFREFCRTRGKYRGFSGTGNRGTIQ